jgi:hypothetical protein
VDAFDLTGAWIGSPINQRNSLWSGDANWWGNGNTGSNSAYPLYARLMVDRDHFYVISVQSGGRVAADGGSEGWSFSWGSARLSASVPSISWELG